MLIRLLKDVNNWNDFKNILESKTKLEKGKAFEELTKYYLQYNPIYKSKLKNVWLQSEVTPSLLKKLNIPSNDQGIDIVAETFEGKFWAIQCKYLQDEDQRLSHRAISTFVSLSTGIAENITYCLVCTTVDDYAKIYQGKTNIGFCNSDEWRKLDKVFFDWLRNKLLGKEKKLIPYLPKPHQTKALQEARQYFIKENNNRGKLVFPCGAGKSLTGYWITRELKAKSVIVAVPSLSLVKQTLEVYLRESVANNEKVEWLCVCSDEGIGKNDDIVVHTNEIGVPCITNRTIISDWLIKNKLKKTIIFTTYQSGKTIAEACKIARHSFNLGIMDEAHKTVGEQDKLFSHLLFEKNIKIEQRIFMTATERRYAGASDTILSMDDISVYGETFAQMSFKEAIEIGILSDYKIVTLFISNEEVRRLIEQNAFVKPTGKDWDRETEARTLAALIALRKAMTKFPINHAVTFHSSIKKAVAFEQSQSHFSTAYPKFSKVKSYHVSGTMPTAVRGKIVDEFAATKKGIITNAKCLTEGIDVPNIDCVLFADPRKSTVDIVQAVGRALRIKQGKKFGYVILPVFTNSNKTEEIIESAEFKEILSTIRALASNDERIIEYFRDVSKGVSKNTATDKLIQFDIDEQIAEHINIQELTGALQLKTWDKLAKLSWMPFEEARELVRNIGLKNGNEWEQYCKSRKKPIDIPNAPSYVYRESGWISMGDWIGTGYIAGHLREFLPFEDAREFAKNLNLNSLNEWMDYCSLGNKPINIPRIPSRTYKNEGWINWGDWLGTRRVATKDRVYWDFHKARLFVQKLKLKNEAEWRTYTKSEKMSLNLPVSPGSVYKNSGWISMGDWLGTGFVAHKLKEFIPFEDAKQKVIKLGLKGFKEWQQYCSSGKKLKNIPSNPEIVYKDNGWVGYGDWLGTGNIQAGSLIYLDFEKSRNIVRKLKLNSIKEWEAFCKSANKPNNIPNAPNHIYKLKGWLNWGDWLGTDRIATKDIIYRNFESARRYVRCLNIKSQKEWFQFYQRGEIPMDIPRNVDRTYKNLGWKGYGDWLGTGIVSNQNKIFLTYDEAKKYVHKLQLRSQKEWNEYCKKNERPSNIPRSPAGVYKNKGWINWQDFLGKNISF
jgi:superfamily II DNA or RNA helicase